MHYSRGLLEFNKFLAANCVFEYLDKKICMKAEIYGRIQMPKVQQTGSVQLRTPKWWSRVRAIGNLHANTFYAR